MPFRGRFGRGRFGRGRFGRGHFGGRGVGIHGGNPIVGVLLPFMFMGLMGSFAISIASTVLANSYVDDSQAKTITIVVTVFYFIGIILMCMWGGMNAESRKKFGKALYIGMVAAFTFTVISDIIALI